MKHVLQDNKEIYLLKSGKRGRIFNLIICSDNISKGKFSSTYLSASRIIN
jgi:hypothetical protein